MAIDSCNTLILGPLHSVSQPPALARAPRLSPHAVLVLIRSNSVFAGGSCACLSLLGRVRGARSYDKGRKVCEANARAQPVTPIEVAIRLFSTIMQPGISSPQLS